MKYADDTSFFTIVRRNTDLAAIVWAAASTAEWSDENNMLLNAEKTVVMNSNLSVSYNYDDDLLSGCVLVRQQICSKFLDMTINNKTTFNEPVKDIAERCSSRLF